MKDFLGNEVAVGDYFVYALTIGRSANLGVYQLKEIVGGEKVKAVKIGASYGFNDHTKYKVWVYDPVEQDGEFRDMTEEERFKVDNKTSTLSMFTTRGCKIDYPAKK